MAMVRITAAITSAIVTALLDKKYLEDNLKLDELEQKSADAEKAMHKLAYEAAYTPAQRKVLLEAPTGYFPMAYKVKIRICDPKNADNYSDTVVSFDDEKPVFYRNSMHVGMFASVIDNDHPYVVAKKAAAEAEREFCTFRGSLAEKKHADRTRIERIIGSVTTVKRLQEIWPQVNEFLPEIVSGPDGNVPVQIIDDINKEFGLDK